MKVRPAQGLGVTLDVAMACVKEVHTQAELIALLREMFHFWKPTAENVSYHVYAYDDRIGWDTHLVCVDGKAAVFTDGVTADTPIMSLVPYR